MTNPQRGEHTVHIEGVGQVTFRLSMGALAEIEHALGCRTVNEMVQRVSNLGVADLIKILKPMVQAGGNKDLPPVEDWPPAFSDYTEAMSECFFSSGFLRRPTVGPAGPNVASQTN